MHARAEVGAVLREKILIYHQLLITISQFDEKLHCSERCEERGESEKALCTALIQSIDENQ